jgi:HEAT repeat protein
MNPKKNNGDPKPRGPELEDVLLELVDSSKPLLTAHLPALSDLDRAAMQEFAAVWPGIASEKRRQVMARLQEISETNVEFNFHSIFKYALADDDETVRKEAIEGLWEDDEPSLIRPLIRLLTQDPSPGVREAAAVALRRFALLVEHQKISADYRRILSQALLEVFNNLAEDLAVRRRALESVSPLSMADVTQAIWAAYRHPEPEFKTSALYAMGQNCDILWLPTILRELENEDPALCYEAVSAAGELGEMDVLPPVVAMLGSSDVDLRLAAVVALGKIGGSEAKRALGTCLTDKSQAVRKAAELALGEAEFCEEPLFPHDQVL